MVWSYICASKGMCNEEVGKKTRPGVEWRSWGIPSIATRLPHVIWSCGNPMNNLTVGTSEVAVGETLINTNPFPHCTDKAKSNSTPLSSEDLCISILLLPVGNTSCPVVTLLQPIPNQSFLISSPRTIVVTAIMYLADLEFPGEYTLWTYRYRGRGFHADAGLFW